MSLSEDLLFENERQAVARAYHLYGRQIGTREWPPYRQDDTEQCVACFDPLIAAMIETCSQDDLNSKALPHRILTQIERLSEALPSANGGPDRPIPITYPWMHRTVFENPEFRAAMHIAISRALDEKRISDTQPADNTRLKPLAGPVRRRRGFAANIQRHRAFADIVNRNAPNWRREARSWKCPDVLRCICVNLDEAVASDGRGFLEIPRTWTTGETQKLRGTKLCGWQHALQMGFIKLVTDQIAASLRNVLKHETEASTQGPT